jgi:hypothetical protein
MATVDISMAQITEQITVRVRGLKGFKLRTRIATWAFWLGGWIAGTPIEMELGERKQSARTIAVGDIPPDGSVAVDVRAVGDRLVRVSDALHFRPGPATKRFLVFAVDRYEAAGGWQDFQAAYATRDDALASPLRRYFSWAEIVDTESGDCTTHDVDPKTFMIKPGPCTPW